MATGLYLTPDGRVAVNYGTRKLFLPMSQYKANGYKPGIEKLSVRDTTGPGPIPIGARAVSDQSVLNPQPLKSFSFVRFEDFGAGLSAFKRPAAARSSQPLA